MRPATGLLLAYLLSSSVVARAQVQTAAPGWAIGSAVEVKWQGEWYPAKVLLVNHGWYKIHYVGYGSEWDELVDAERMRAPRADGKPEHHLWKVGDAVEVEWHRGWYPAAILEANHGWYRIHYVGYDASSDEIVEDARVRKANPLATPPVEPRDNLSRPEQLMAPSSE